MKQELQEKLVKKYPEIFAEVGSSPQQSCMAFGIDVGDGWYWLIDKLCNHLQYDINNNKEPQIVSAQVKEKWGGLRFYVNSASDKQFAIIGFVEDISMSICETCGSIENVRQTETGWIKTTCLKCMCQGL